MTGMRGDIVTSGETLPRASGRGEAGVTGVVVIAHGGKSVSTEPTMALQPAVIRMIPVARAIAQALRGSGAMVFRPRFVLRGWNGEQASPVHDFSRILTDVGDRFGPVPIVLVGHSMAHAPPCVLPGIPLWWRWRAWRPGCHPANPWRNWPDAGSCSRTAPPTASPVRPTPGRSRSGPAR